MAWKRGRRMDKVNVRKSGNELEVYVEGEWYKCTNENRSMAEVVEDVFSMLDIEVVWHKKD